MSRPASAREQRQRKKVTNTTTGAILSYLNTPASDGIGLQDAKDPSALDWYVEGPGRRVGYDNLTAIDWIFEYSKERQRLRVLAANTTGLLGYARQLADDSQVWLILIATGIAVGGIAAGIDVASDWLGDLKTGYCSNVNSGGKFYLNKYFCCWGLDGRLAPPRELENTILTRTDFDKCMDWRSWSTAMGVHAAGGSWIIDFIFYFIFSVGIFPVDF